MALRAFLFAIATTAWLVAAAAQPDQTGLLGRWQYIQPPDFEGEVLDIRRADGRYRGVMNGLERAGEHGLFYYVVDVDDLEVAADGSLSFTVGTRTFFATRPPLSAVGVEGTSGVSRYPMRFGGGVVGGELVLRCEGSGGSCPDTILRFKRLPMPR